jgi:N-acetylglucosamine-6-sulfatase
MQLAGRILTRRWLPLTFALALAAGVTAIAVIATGGKRGGTAKASVPSTPAAETGARRRPNVVVVMTDDQAASQVRYMPNVRRLLGRAGTTFLNFYCTYPLCAPSRATFLTGQYDRNDGVRENGGNNGGFHALDGSETLPVWLQRAGYQTAMLGKYINGYAQKGTDATLVPPGWNEWDVVAPEGRNYDYTLNQNGQLVSHGHQPQDYLTDVLAGKATDFIRRSAAAHRPFFVYMATQVPHDEQSLGSKPNPRPAPRDAGAFAALPLPRPPNFNEADVSDKPAFIRNRPLIPPQNINQIARRYRDRTASLLAVDDAVASIVRTLKATGQLNNTMVAFTTDNGFFFGEHRLPNGKVLPYDPASKVPLLVRGPGFKHHNRSRTVVGNIDLAPTIVALAHARAGRRMDGRSLLPILRGHRVHWKRSLLLEAGDGIPNRPNRSPERALDYTAVRSSRWLYVEWETGETELYDMRRDPYQLNNLAADPRYAGTRAALARRLALLRDCKGSACLR